jgi:hypothetical protein
MRNRPVAASTRKSIVSSVVLAGLTSLALLGHIESVSAKNMTACQAKHADCSERCIMNTESEGKGNACIQRTCTHQFRACASQSGESSNPYHDQAGMKPPKGVRPIVDGPPRSPRPRPKRPSRGPRPTELTSQSPGSPADQVRVPRGPLGGGILDSLGLGGVRQQGPAAAGSPMTPAAAPSAPPVVIR